MSRIRADRYTNRLGTGAPLFSNGVNITGNVGVGTTVPTSKLTVLGDMNVSGIITAQSGVHVTSGNVGIGTDGPFGKLQVKAGTDANFSFSTGGGEASLEILNDAGSANVPLNVRASEYKFKIQGNEKVRIDANGRLGIGTDNPGELLHLYTNSSADVKIESTSNTGIAAITLKANGGQVNFGEPGGVDNRGQIQYSNAANTLNGAAADRMEFFTNNDISNAAITITSGNNIGIGTAVPNRKLVISQANSTAYSGTDFDQDYHVLKLNNFTDSKTVGMQFLIGSNGEAAITATETSDGATDLAFGTRGGGNRAERLRIHSDGNVTKPSQCFVFLGMSATTISGTGNVTQDIWGVNSTYVGVDVGGDWDTSTKTFTAPVDGVYHYDWQIRYSNWTGSIYYVYQRMYTSTSPVNTGNKLCLWTPSIYNNPAGTQYYTKSMSGDMKMSAGDTLQPDFVVSGSGAVTFSIDGGSVSGQCDSYLSIRLVQ